MIPPSKLCSRAKPAPARAAQAIAERPPRLQCTTISISRSSLDLRGLTDVYSPIVNNAIDWRGEPITAGFSQWREGDHFVAFDDPRATAMYEEFFVSTVQGQPTIVVEEP